MSRKPRRRRSFYAGPIYIFILVWLGAAMVMPLYRLSGLLIAVGVSVLAGVLAGRLFRRRARKKEPAQAEAAPEAAPEPEPQPVQPQKPRYSPEVEAVLADGKLAMKEMGQLYASIPDPEIRKKINEIMAVSDKIFQDAVHDPSDVPQIRRFLDFFLPTTIKLLNAYDRMGAQGIAGENISGSMRRIEDMLDSSIQAYKKQLDALFANQAADIQTDIDAMNSMLAREGLGGQSYLDLNDFMKQYNEQKKGSTANG